MEAICKTCKHCSNYLGSNAPVLNIKTHYDVNNGNEPTPFSGSAGGKCEYLDYYILDVAECDCYEAKE